MKKFKSITVNEATFAGVDRLAETLLPRVKLSRAQVVEYLVKKKKEEKNEGRSIDESKGNRSSD